MIGRVDHIALAVESIAEALKTFRDGLGLEVTHVEQVDSQGVRVAILPVGETRLELLEPTDASGTVARFLQRRGEGIHHICFEVDDVETALALLRTRGIRPVREQPSCGSEGTKVAFLQPSAVHGVLIELRERDKCT